MANYRLNTDELATARELLNDIRQQLTALANGSDDLLFAFRRKIYKELSYDERLSPAKRKRLKKRKWHAQDGDCPLCGNKLKKYTGELDRFKAKDSYTEANTRLVHHACHVKDQRKKGFK